MTRLINADELRKTVNDFYDEHFIGLVPDKLITYAEAVDNFIDNAPTVTSFTIEDIEGIRAETIKMMKNRYARPQGEWIKLRDYDFKCSLCGFSIMDKYNFCPECGAEMRGNGD